MLVPNVDGLLKPAVQISILKYELEPKWLRSVVCCLLFVGCWLLVVGCWLLVVGCWLLFLTRAEASQQVHVHSSLKFIVQESSMAKNSSPSRAPKNGAQLRENPGGARKKAKKAKNPFKPPGRHKTNDEILSRFPVRTCAWISENTFT